MAKKLRVAVYHNLHSGGALRALRGMLNGLKDNFALDLYSLTCSENHFFDLIALANNNFQYEFSPLPQIQKPFGRLNFVARYIDLFRVDSIQKKIARDIDHKGYDVAFIHHCQFTQSPAILNYLKTPTVYYCNEPLRSAYEPAIYRPYNEKRSVSKFLDKIDFIKALFNTKRKKIDNAAARTASSILTNSFYSREAIYRVYGKDARVVYPGIDTELFHPVDSTKDGGLLSVGALTPLKGFDFIIRSLALMPPHKRPRLTIASNYQEPAEKAYLQQMSRDAGVDLRLLNKIGDDVLVQLYNQAQATVCSSVMEPFGLTPLESMACQTPVIAVAEGGLRETIIPGQTGLYIDRDPAQGAQAIQEIIDNPDNAFCMGERGRDHVINHWTWENSIPRLAQYLKDNSEG